MKKYILPLIIVLCVTQAVALLFLVRYITKEDNPSAKETAQTSTITTSDNPDKEELISSLFSSFKSILELPTDDEERTLNILERPPVESNDNTIYPYTFSVTVKKSDVSTREHYFFNIITSNSTKKVVSVNISIENNIEDDYITLVNFASMVYRIAQELDENINISEFGERLDLISTAFSQKFTSINENKFNVMALASEKVVNVDFSLND